MNSALTASAINVNDLEATPLTVARFETGREDAVGGIYIRTTSATRRASTSCSSTP